MNVINDASILTELKPAIDAGLDFVCLINIKCRFESWMDNTIQYLAQTAIACVSEVDDHHEKHAYGCHQLLIKLAGYTNMGPESFFCNINLNCFAITFS